MKLGRHRHRHRRRLHRRPRAPAGRFAIGAGDSPDEGFLARAEVAHDDLFRAGQQLALSAEISALRQRFLLAHEVPDLLGGGLDLRAELSSDRRAYPGLAREETGGAVTLGKRLARATRVYARAIPLDGDRRGARFLFSLGGAP